MHYRFIYQYIYVLLYLEFKWMRQNTYTYTYTYTRWHICIYMYIEWINKPDEITTMEWVLGKYCSAAGISRQLVFIAFSGTLCG